MLFNYFKIAFRNLGKNKAFSAINILGLAVGMASAILIFLWIAHEISYDRFHAKKDRIYEAWNKGNFNGKVSCWNTTPKILAKALQSDIPEIETTTRVNWSDAYLTKYGDKTIMMNASVVDSTFLQVFSFPVLKGDSATALMHPTGVVLSATTAEKLFGNNNPIGQIIELNETYQLTVTAVVQDAPNNSRFKFDCLVPWAFMRKMGGDDDYWGNNSTRTYALLKPGTRVENANAKLVDFRKKYDRDDPKGGFFLYPIERWRLYSNFTDGVEEGGLIEYIRIFSIVGAIILLIACINFMNLSTAKSEQRAKEVGIRKVIGAMRHNLMGQFLGESILIAFFAGLLSILIVQLTLPAFNSFTGKIVHLNYSSISAWSLWLGFIIVTGLIAGSYPAFFLSGFQPTKVLKGSFKKAQAAINPRKILVVLQFTFAIILIISTLVINKQLSHARNRNNGYNKDQLVYYFMTGSTEKNYDLIKNELLSSGTATSVTKTSAPLTEGWSNTWGISWKGKQPNDRTLFDRFCADQQFITTAGLELVKGRDMDLAVYPTDSMAMLLNESAVTAMGFKDPIGQVIQDNGREWTVIGVFKDFIMHSPFAKTEPMFIQGAKGWFNVIHFRLNPANTVSANLKKAETIFKKFNPSYPFDYTFVDQAYAAKFEEEGKMGSLAALFAGLTIFISCMGLFGLATYMAATRFKEIGIRKVLGASVASISTLLSKDFLKLVLISFIIASPVAWFLMNKWLQTYAYKTSIDGWVFLSTGLLSMLIAVLTTSIQAIKAALSNPVKSLKSE
ncbi:ABC transporter permease [Flavihumibacter sp. CACIAM 22H1]|uniref:ABC transporter permease n=1 Tax=Flavihumibacter sp. CACIAM 22H1 TaxID=1812911 RepID=UPI0007A86CF0|nr:ABC transporter permease [Flavihumibacter sp. CACIAM 22H1]KYP14491.1 MAG: ABC transporter permease [Flavihumibacter sp. CACIAM 22H1]